MITQPVKDRVRNFLASEQTPRGWLIVGAIATFAASVAPQIYFHLDNKLAANEAAQRQEVLAQEAAQRQELLARRDLIRDMSIDLQTYAGAFVSAVLEGDDPSEDRERLLAGLTRLHEALEFETDTQGSDVPSAASGYSEAIRKWATETRAVSEVSEMRKFWEAASDALVRRDDFLRDMVAASSNG